VVYTLPVATHGMLDSFVCCKVDGMRGSLYDEAALARAWKARAKTGIRTGADNNAGHASPQLEDALSRRNSHGTLDHALVYGARVDDLHARLQSKSIG
jgi:hypothetical protein